VPLTVPAAHRGPHVRAAVVEGEELVVHAHHTDRAAADLDEATAVAAYLLDRADREPHAASRVPVHRAFPIPIDLPSMAPTPDVFQRNRSAEESA
jgi:hypothetical protein